MAIPSFSCRNRRSQPSAASWCGAVVGLEAAVCLTSAVCLATTRAGDRCAGPQNFSDELNDMMRTDPAYPHTTSLDYGRGERLSLLALQCL